jgi:hypothetical protein
MQPWERLPHSDDLLQHFRTSGHGQRRSMAHVHMCTCFLAAVPTAFEFVIKRVVWCNTNTLAVTPSHDADIARYTASPRNKHLNVHAKPFSPTHNIKKPFHYQNRHVFSGIIARDVNSGFATPPKLAGNSHTPVPPPNGDQPFSAQTRGTRYLTPPPPPPDRYALLLSRIEERQEDLRDARDDLVGSRFRLRTKRQGLRTTRDKTVSRIGGAFDLTRRYFLARGLDVPQELMSAWSEVDDVRDILGEQETDYEAEEEKYNSEEWMYTEKEKAFLDGLSEDMALRTDSFEDIPSIGHVEDLPHFSFDSPRASVDYAVFEELNPSSIAELKAPVYFTEESSEAQSAGTTELLKLSPDSPIWRSQDDTTLVQQSTQIGRLHQRMGWLETHKIIEDWMFEFLMSSRLQKASLEALVPKGGLSDQAWCQLVAHHWKTDSSDSSAFHTGDTTISGEALSHAMSSNTKQDLSEVPCLEDVDTRSASVGVLLPENRHFDALESVDFPIKIKRDDLVDVPRHVTFLVRASSGHSKSIRYTGMTGLECDSNSAINEKWSDTSSGSDNTVRHAEDSPKDKPTAEDLHDYVVVTPVSDPNHLSGTAGTSIPDTQQVSDLSVPSAHQISSTTCSPDSNDASPTQVELHDNDSVPPNSTHARRPRSHDDRSDFIGARLQTRHPFAPFIRVKSPKPWNLPLLRMTPLPTSDPPVSQHIERLENIPFVFISNTPFRLPGPSRFPGTSSYDLYE